MFAYSYIISSFTLSLTQVLILLRHFTHSKAFSAFHCSIYPVTVYTIYEPFKLFLHLSANDNKIKVEFAAIFVICAAWVFKYFVIVCYFQIRYSLCIFVSAVLYPIFLFFPYLVSTSLPLFIIEVIEIFFAFSITHFIYHCQNCRMIAEHYFINFLFSNLIRWSYKITLLPFIPGIKLAISILATYL